MTEGKVNPLCNNLIRKADYSIQQSTDTNESRSRKNWESRMSGSEEDYEN